MVTDAKALVHFGVRNSFAGSEEITATVTQQCVATFNRKLSVSIGPE